MSIFPARKCLEKAPGCHGTYAPKKFWQMTCDNPACKKQRKRRMTEEWKQRNAEREKKYQAAYRVL